MVARGSLALARALALPLVALGRSASLVAGFRGRYRAPSPLAPRAALAFAVHSNTLFHKQPYRLLTPSATLRGPESRPRAGLSGFLRSPLALARRLLSVCMRARRLNPRQESASSPKVAAARRLRVLRYRFAEHSGVRALGSSLSLCRVHEVSCVGVSGGAGAFLRYRSAKRLQRPPPPLSRSTPRWCCVSCGGRLLVGSPVSAGRPRRLASQPCLASSPAFFAWLRRRAMMHHH